MLRRCLFLARFRFESTLPSLHPRVRPSIGSFVVIDFGPATLVPSLLVDEVSVGTSSKVCALSAARRSLLVDFTAGRGRWQDG